MEKLKTNHIIVVEGKYDKIKLENIIDAHIITTNGFGLFNSNDKKKLLSVLSQDKKIVILTDSDSAGFVIRNKLKGFVRNPQNIINIYAPKLEGKEQRKSAPSKEGLLGIEGTDDDILRNILINSGICDDNKKTPRKAYTKAYLYEIGLCGKPDSTEKRAEILRNNNLPENMSAKAFLEIINLLGIDL